MKMCLEYNDEYLGFLAHHLIFNQTTIALLRLGQLLI